MFFFHIIGVLHFFHLSILDIPEDNGSIGTASDQCVVCVHGKGRNVMGAQNVVLKIEKHPIQISKLCIDKQSHSSEMIFFVHAD